MGMTIIEKILASHSGSEGVQPGEIVDVFIDARAARDFGGANVVKHMEEHQLSISDAARTLFTFDCNPTGSDQKYATNQHKCRLYARENGLKVYDIDKGIGTHILIEEGLAYPGSTAISTDSHANILGAVGAFGQGMGDKDIAAAWHKGRTWFKVPKSARIRLQGKRPDGLTAKDMVLNLLHHFGSNTLLGYSIELEGEVVEALKLDERITISSMATEMGAIALIIAPNEEVLRYCESRAKKKIEPVFADEDAQYEFDQTLDVSKFRKRLSLPGKPHDTAELPEEKIWIDSAFIGSCTNGRLSDIASAACILKGRKVAENVVLKVVPATNKVWEQALELGYIQDIKEAGALISNAGCAGCAAGQVGQNGPGEVTISTGNRNFPGKQGKGEVYLAAPDVVAASAIAGYIVSPALLPEKPEPRPSFVVSGKKRSVKVDQEKKDAPETVTGRAWVIQMDDIDTDMIFHNMHLAITELEEMGKYAFGNLEGYSDFASKAKPGDIIIAGKNFGSGSSRQQAVDCFKALGISAIIAQSFGAIYERNAINAAFPILSCQGVLEGGIKQGDTVTVDFRSGSITSGAIALKAVPFSDVQMEIYTNNGLF